MGPLSREVRTVRDALLVGRTGKLAGQTFPFGRRLSLGRAPTNDVPLPGALVSRHHVVIEEREEGLVLTDLGSRNGTRVNGEPVQVRVLRTGDRISIGEFVFDVIIKDTPGYPQSPAATLVEVRESELTIATELRVAAAAAGELSADAAANREGGALRLAYLVLVKATESFALERDLASLFGKILDYVFEVIPAHRGVIFTRDEEAGEFHPVAEKVKGISSANSIVVSRTLLKRAADEAKAILTVDAPHDARFRGSESISLHGIRSAMCVPMLHDGELQGILYLDTVGRVEKFDAQGLQLLAAISAPAAIAVKNTRYIAELDRRADQLRKSYYDTLKVVVDSLEVRDYYTIGHGRRVALFSRIIAEEMGWDEEKLKLVEMGGILHDLGKIGIEDAILRKAGALTEEEMEQMQFHPEIGARIVRDADFLKPILPYILYHQERFDGSGHPYHLKGEEIPVEGRLMAVADAFDAMTSDRPYRKAMDAEQAIRVVEEGSEQQFDPQVVQAFLGAWQKGKITKAMLSSGQKVKTTECPFCSSEIEIRLDSPDPYLIRCPTCHKRARL